MQATVDQVQRLPRDRRELAMRMLLAGQDTSPVRHWTQGAARMVQGVLGGYELGQADREQAAADARHQGTLLGSFGGTPAPDRVTGGLGEAATNPAGETAAPSAPVAGLGGDQARQAMSFFTERGYSPVAAAAMVGNLFKESSLNTGARNPGDGRDGSDSIGIAQWNSDRARNLQAFAAQRGRPVTDFQTQLEFVDQELRGSERRWGDQLRAAQDPDAAARAAISYFRPAGWTANNPAGGHNFQRRLDATRQLLGTMGVGRQVAAPADILTGSDGEPAPLAAPAMTPGEAMNAPAMPASRTIAQQRAMAMMLGAPEQAAAPVEMQDRAPMPVPTPRPVVPDAPQAAPVPMARPNMAAPVPAAPAMSARDAIMIARDAESMAPGDVAATRAAIGSPGSQPSVSPLVERVRSLLLPGNAASPQGAPVGAQTPAPATHTAPAPSPAPTAPQAGAPNARIQALMAAYMDRNASPEVRQMAQGLLQQEVARLNPQYGFQNVQGLGLVRTDPRTGAVQTVAAVPEAPTILAEGATAINRRGEVIARNGERQTDEDRNYASYRRDQEARGAPVLPRFEWGQQQRRAAANNVTVDNRSQDALEKSRGEGLGGMLNDIAKDGNDASTELLTVQRIQQLMTAVEPGTRTAALEAIRRQTGIALDPNASNVQALGAALEYMIPRMRVPGSGATSDRDMASFRAALPSLLGSAQGNDITLNTLAGIIQHRQERALIARQWQTGQITAPQALEQINKLGDPFAAFKQYQDSARAGTAGPNTNPANTGAPRASVRVSTPEEAQKLAPGTRYTTPDGAEYVR